jgi:hypothetical protein
VSAVPEIAASVGRVRAAGTPGARPSLLWAPTEKLMVDRRFQRSLSRAGEALVRRIVTGFSWRLFGVLTAVDNGDGTWGLIDGQHRAVAAHLHPAVTLVPILETDAETLAEQARDFVEINRSRTPMNALQLHKARRLSGDESAAAVHRALARAGVSVPGNTVGLEFLKPRQALCIGSFYQVLRAGGEAHLDRVLAVVAAAWPDSAGDILATVVRAADVALAAGADRDALTRLLASRAGIDWADEARRLGRAESRSGYAALADRLLQLLAQGRAA